MIVLKKALPRRTFLRGIGATLALPLLDAMVPAMSALAATPAAPVRRLGFVFIPMGCDGTRWTPPGGRGEITSPLPGLPQTLRPHPPWKDNVPWVTIPEVHNAFP